MAFERIKARVGWSEDTQRYADTEDYRPPQAVEDPHTIDDSTRETALDKLLANRWWALSVSLLALVALVFVAIHFGRYFATALANPWVQRVGVAAVLVGVGRYTGRSDERSKLEEEHELTLYDPESGDTVHFAGKYKPVEGATHDTFVPYKGRRRNDPEPYRIGELSTSLVKQHGRDRDQPAQIRLHSSLVSVVQTERGLKVTQLTAGLTPDPFGRESNLEATIPSLAATETVSDLKSELEKQDEEIDHLREKNDQLRRQRDNARDEARKNYQEVRQEIEKNVEMLEPFANRQAANSSSESDEERRRRKKRQLRNGDDA